MKEMDDEELQRLFTDGHLSPDECLPADANAYRALFDALKTEPENGLPYDFAAKVARQIRAGQKRGSELRPNLLAACLFLITLTMICYALAILSPESIPALLKYKWVLVLLPVGFIGIQYFDQKLVKTRIFNNRSYKP